MSTETSSKEQDVSNSPSFEKDNHDAHSTPAPGGSTAKAGDAPTYPGAKERTVILIAIYLAVFLVSLDRTIISTAIPTITDEFNSIDDIGWYGSAYLLTGCACQLIYGRIYTFYPTRIVYLVSILLLEVGSALCGAAPNSTSFIVGRAIAGIGSGGIFSGAIIIIVQTIPLAKRPMYQGLVGAIFGISSVVGPLMGGAFTRDVSWRWCFYINLPIGAVVALIVFFILKVPTPKKAGTSLRDQLIQLDPLGTFFLLPSVICFLLALQWGGSTYAWSNARIIVLFVLAGLLFGAFVAVEIWRQESALVPPRIFKQRSVLSGVVWTSATGSCMMLVVYYFPLWAQAIKDVNAVKSGLMILPTVLSLVCGSVLSGFLVTRFGYYVPFMYACAVVMSVGAGLLTTFTPDTGHPTWIGYQVVFGFGLGLGMQAANIGVQTCLAREDVPTGAAMLFFSMQIASSVFLSVGQNIFTNRLIAGLAQVRDLPVTAIMNVGATDLRKMVSAEQVPEVLRAYNYAITKVFDVVVAMACLSIVGALGAEWRSVKKAQPEQGPEREGKSESAKESV